MIPTHPFVGDLSELTPEQLSEKISELNKRFSFAARTHNSAMLQQIQMLLASYRAEYDRKQAEIWNKGKSEFKPKIDIS